jgi:serine protein kinase
MMAQFSVLSRLKEPENSSIFLQDAGLRRREPQGHRPQGQELPGIPRLRRRRRGHDRLSTRFAFKILSKVFNFDHREVAANPVHLMYVLEQQIEQEQFPPESKTRYLRFIKEFLARATPSSSARRSRPPTWKATPSTARTSSTAT